MALKLGIFCCFLLLCVLLQESSAGPYFEDGEASDINELDAVPVEPADYELDDILRAAQQKRGCIRRGGNCDHRPNDCCYSSSCRCNLWGSNCRCQRMGLFQKWG